MGTGRSHPGQLAFPRLVVSLGAHHLGAGIAQRHLELMILTFDKLALVAAAGKEGEDEAGAQTQGSAVVDDIHGWITPPPHASRLAALTEEHSPCHPAAPCPDAARA